LDRFTRNIAHDEDDARARIGVLPMLERHRRMKQVLRSLQHDGTAFTYHVNDTLDAQQIRTTQRSERLQRRIQLLPGEWLVEPQTERIDGGVVRYGPRRDPPTKQSALLFALRFRRGRIE